MAWTRIGLSLLMAGGIGVAAAHFFSGQPQSSGRAVLTAPGMIRLGGNPIEVRLRPPENSDTTVNSIVKALKPGEKTYLVLRGLSTDRQPGVVFQVFWGSRGEKGIGGAEDRLLGTFNFFSVPERPAESVPAPSERTTRSFDITRSLRSLPPTASELVVTIQPSGTPVAGASPAIGAAEVVIMP